MTEHYDDNDETVHTSESDDNTIVLNDDTLNKMKIDYAYPAADDDDIQYKLYKKRELYSHKYATRPNMDNNKDIQEHRENICDKEPSFYDHQALLGNFINPNTPYTGLLIFHGVGTGKTCSAIAIAEQFKPTIQKYNTKIYVIVPGPLIKENWKNELLKCTGDTYVTKQDKYIYISEHEKTKNEKNGISQALQYYKFMSYRSFYRRVIGEKIADKRVVDDSVKVSYRKDDDGEFERDLAIDRLDKLDNSVLIVDEAHGLTGNYYGDSLKKIIKNSTNLRVILLTATPMKNYATEIIEMLNYLRPTNSQIERDMVFDNNKNHLMNFKDGGIDYLKKMASGYISHLRGGDPLTYAKRVDMGNVPKELLFTKMTQCKMNDFQRKIYDEAVKEQDDILDRKSESVANFAFPGLSNDKKQLAGYYGREGIDIVRAQLKLHYELLNKKIAEDIIKDKNEKDLIYLSSDGKTVTGKILQLKYLKYFSIKFYTALVNLNKLVWGENGDKNAFIYSNLVKVGIDMFQEVLLQNGYLEFQENSNDYAIKPDTRCYFCGRPHSEHASKKSHLNKRMVAERDEFVGKKTQKGGENDIPTHKYYPATFISVTGKSAEDATEYLPEDKQRVLKNIFSNITNKNGKFIKFVLGSKVMNEGISLKHVGEVHILDVHYNLGRIDQVVGRGIRHCSHYKLMNENNMFPEVNVYKYAVTLGDGSGLSTEEELYRKAEHKYLLIKKTERALKTVAIDCPLNMNGNMFKEEIDEFKDCKEKNNCPAICDYTDCHYKCDNPKLNLNFYDPDRMIYKKIAKKNLDYSTFTPNLAKNEIDYSKKKIKELFGKKHVYTIDVMLSHVKDSYVPEKKDLFDQFFVFKALDELLPVSENDFNNFKDIIYDKYNRHGYLIFVNNYYIFQPFEQNEDVPMHYRVTYDKQISQQLSLHSYLKNTQDFQDFIGHEKVDDEIEIEKNDAYDFDSVMSYYDSRDEYKMVGIIDKEFVSRKNKQANDGNDVFKIREMRPKILDKKRGTGIPSLKGAVCSTSKNKKYLENIAKDLKIAYKNDSTRTLLCEQIKDKMLFLEKYGTTKNKDKITYVMVPKNHKTYAFPYNLEDRVDFIQDIIKTNIIFKLNISVKIENKNKGPEKGYPTYKIIIKNKPELKEHTDFLSSINAKLSSDTWIILIE